MRSFLLRLVSALFFLIASPVPAATAARPKLIIAISVDQFAASVYARYRDDFSGGLKRLSSGIAFPVGYQSHAATETCPGHSTGALQPASIVSLWRAPSIHLLEALKG